MLLVLGGAVDRVMTIVLEGAVSFVVLLSVNVVYVCDEVSLDNVVTDVVLTEFVDSDVLPEIVTVVFSGEVETVAVVDSVNV